MIRELNGGLLIAAGYEIDGKYILFTRERVVLQLIAVCKPLSEVVIQTDNGEVRMISDWNGSVDCDLTDMLRSQESESGELIIDYTDENDDTQHIDREYALMNGISPYNWRYPQSSEQCTGASDGYIFPPAKVLIPNDMSYNHRYTERPSFATHPYSELSAMTATGSVLEEWDGDIGRAVLNFAPSAFKFEGVANEYNAELVSFPYDELVGLKWLNRMGVECIAFFRRRKMKQSVDSRSIEVLSSGVYTQRGLQEECEVYIDGLDSYSLNYYADIFYSPKVEMMTERYEWSGNPPRPPQFVDMYWRQVSVETKNMTLPDGNDGKLHELSFTLKYFQYDTI